MGTAMEADEAAGKQHTKTLHVLTNRLCNVKPRQSVTVKDTNGSNLTSIDQRRERWKEHFTGILNRQKPGKSVSEDDGKQHEEAEIDTGFVREAEIKRAIKNVKQWKSAR